MGVYLCVEDSEANCHGQVDPGFEEGDDLSAAARCSHNQHVLPAQHSSQSLRIIYVNDNE